MFEQIYGSSHPYLAKLLFCVIVTHGNVWQGKAKKKKEKFTTMLNTEGFFFSYLKFFIEDNGLYKQK